MGLVNSVVAHAELDAFAAFVEKRDPDFQGR
jgi:hypothetical protein